MPEGKRGGPAVMDDGGGDGGARAESQGYYIVEILL
jgi:hypothetical protein